MLVLEYIWIFEYPQVFFAGDLDIWSLGAALPRGQGGKIGNLPNQQPPRAPEIVPHKKENFKNIITFSGNYDDALHNQFECSSAL